MKVLIGYDGSECSDAALRDLKRAGLPDGVDARVVSVADVYLAPTTRAADVKIPHWFVAHSDAARARSAQELAEADALAARAGETLRAAFPNWSVQTASVADSPAWGLIKTAEAWGADLVVVGSHGRSAIQRLVLGSVSQVVVTNAHCSVRVARGRDVADGTPVRVVVGVDGSPDADAAVAAVAARAWPAGSEVHLLSAIDPQVVTAMVSYDLPILQWVEEEDEHGTAWVQTMANAAAERLRAAGLAVSTTVKDSDPKQMLLEEAERWQADCIFVGTRGLRRMERVLLGSVSSAVAARAHCSVEVVRPAVLPAA